LLSFARTRLIKIIVTETNKLARPMHFRIAMGLCRYIISPYEIILITLQNSVFIIPHPAFSQREKM
jgi:hypothetical protein